MRRIDDGSLSPADADRLLKRASELDLTRSGAMSIEQLRQSAIDAGIDASAFDAALRELQHESSQLSQTRRPATTTDSFWSRMSGLGLTVGAATELFRPFARIDGLHTDRLGASALLISAFAFLLLHHGRSGRHAAFQRDLAALFISFVVGFWAAHGGVESAGPWVAMIAIAGWIWIGTSVLGAALIALIRRSRPSQAELTLVDEPQTADAAEDAGVKRAVLPNTALLLPGR